MIVECEIERHDGLKYKKMLHTLQIIEYAQLEWIKSVTIWSQN